MLNPGVLDGPGDVFDDEDKETVPKETLRSLASNFERFGVLFSAIDAGSIVLSIGEFERLPATFHDAWRIFRQTRTKFDDDRRKGDGIKTP